MEAITERLQGLQDCRSNRHTHIRAHTLNGETLYLSIPTSHMYSFQQKVPIGSISKQHLLVLTHNSQRETPQSLYLSFSDEDETDAEQTDD